MGNKLENRHQTGAQTGPHGTRVFDPADIQRSFGNQRAISTSPAGRVSGATLTGLNGRLQDRQLAIPAGRSTVGRSPGNDIVVDVDSVSHVHARFVQRGDEWWILNLLSTNGTFVNDDKVTDTRLRDGDRIQFGDARFVFHNPQPKRRPGLGWLYRLGGLLRALLRN